MWPFASKKPEKELNSHEYETLFKRNVELEARIRRLELSEEDFRDKILRKIQTKKGEPSVLPPGVGDEQPTTGARMFGGGRR